MAPFPDLAGGSAIDPRDIIFSLVTSVYSRRWSRVFYAFLW